MNTNPQSKIRDPKWSHLLALILLSSFAIRHASFAAEAPLYIPFQGQVTNQQGTIVADGQYSVIFNLYDQAVGGQPVWSERHTKIGVTRGMINVFLGSIAPLTSVDFSQTKYLGITVDTDNLATTADPEMVPRSLILPSFYSHNSAKMAGHDWSAIMRDGSNNPTNNPVTGFLRGDSVAPGSISSDRIADGTITFADLEPGIIDSLSGSLVQSPPVPSFTALEDIAALKAVAVTTDNQGVSKILQASTADGLRSAFYGFAKTAAAAGDPVVVQQYGPLAGFNGLVTGMSYYLSPLNGEIAVTGGSAPVYVGHALSSTVLFVDSFGATRSWGGSNYWGNGADLALDTGITGSFSIPNTLNGTVVVKQYTNLTINAGHTVTTQHPCRGLVIYVNGDCTINGTLSMTARGASVNPVAIQPSGIRLIRIKSDGPGQTLAAADLGLTGEGEVGNDWKNVELLQRGAVGNGKIYTIEKTGGGGGAGIYEHYWYQERHGNTGISKQDGTGGGGSGAVSGGWSGRGGAGTCYSGGSGGGGRSGGEGSGGSAGSGSDSGGGGGNGSHEGHATGDFTSGGGGAGNPGGSGANTGSSVGNPGQPGTGGLLVLLVKGNLTIGATGMIESRGSAGGSAGRSGGSSGGGRILILHAGAYSAANEPTAAGGAKTGNGGAGGAGWVTIDKINR